MVDASIVSCDFLLNQLHLGLERVNETQKPPGTQCFLSILYWKEIFESRLERPFFNFLPNGRKLFNICETSIPIYQLLKGDLGSSRGISSIPL